MNKYTIQVKTSSSDKEIVSNTDLNIVDFSTGGNYHPVQSHLWQARDYNHLTLSDVVIDLYRLASSVYISDKTIPRKTAFDNWTRDILLCLPVHDVSLWEKNAATVNELLSFLTGDLWQIVFQQDHSLAPQPDSKLAKKGNPLSAESVTLFSGGLDSFIGSVESVVNHESTALVAHTDHAHISKTQSDLYKKIKDHFPNQKVELVQFFLQPRNSQENTTRSRSILFLTLGTVIASAIQVKELLVPENGVISLNVPLTHGRLGSLSTKTTHPYTLSLFNDLLKGLGINVKVRNPFQFKTKGEMLSESKDFDFLKEVGSETMSCSHSTAARWEGKPSNKHCGYCLPCLIRRAAFYKSKLDDPKQYLYDILDADFLKYDNGKSGDLRAILYALEGRGDTSSVVKVIKTGPLHPRTEIDNFAHLYERGMVELENLVTQK